MGSEKHVMLIEFTQHIGPYQEQMVALFDERDFSEEEARAAIQEFPLGYDVRIVVMSKQQYETVFRSLKQKND